MKVTRKFSPTSIVIESEDELHMIQYMLTEHLRHERFKVPGIGLGGSSRNIKLIEEILKGLND